jgi:cell pole-organizing protein PopZ
MGDMSREPSMEDILSSIRRVIARDEAPGAREMREPAREDVLELRDAEDDYDADPAPESDAAEELVSPASADAARQSLEALTAAVAPAVAAAVTAPAAAGRTLEDVVTDALRPMLKEWLDANLPTMVEAMVAKEISRITGRRL